jgi:hypothetical protein
VKIKAGATKKITKAGWSHLGLDLRFLIFILLLNAYDCASLPHLGAVGKFVLSALMSLMLGSMDLWATGRG